MGFLSSIVGSVVGNGYNPNKWLTSGLQVTDGGLGNQFGSIWNDLSGAGEQMDFNAAEAQKNRDWQEHMANTALQRQMADAKAAGLNPSLLYGSGQGGATGANTPSGSTASAPGTSGNPISAITEALSGLGMLAAQKRNLEARTTLTEKQAGKTEAETNGIEIENKYKDQKEQLQILLAQTTNNKLRADINKVIAETNKIDKEVAKMDDEIAILKSEGKIKEAEAKTRTRNRRAYAALEMTESATRSVANVVGAAKGTSAMPFNVNSKGVNATYHQPGSLWNQ